MNGVIDPRTSPPSLPPPAPRPGAGVVRCARCGNMLGIAADGWLSSRYRGRTIDAALPARIQCEDCGHKTPVPLDEPSALNIT